MEWFPGMVISPMQVFLCSLQPVDLQARSWAQDNCHGVVIGTSCGVGYPRVGVRVEILLPASFKSLEGKPVALQVRVLMGSGTGYSHDPRGFTRAIPYLCPTPGCYKKCS